MLRLQAECTGDDPVIVWMSNGDGFGLGPLRGLEVTSELVVVLAEVVMTGLTSRGGGGVSGESGGGEGSGDLGRNGGGGGGG